jgi:Bacterial Ig-like domain
MRSDRRSRRSKVHRSAKVEPLERRSLLSSLAPSSAPGEQISIQVPSAYISDRVSTIDVTLQRSPEPGGPGASAAAQAQALLAQPLAFELSISPALSMSGSDPVSTAVPKSRRAALAMAKRTLAALQAGLVSPPAGGSLTPATGTPPEMQSVTFPAGVASVTVTVSLAQLESSTGSAQLALSIVGGGSQVYGVSQQIDVVSGPDAIPPTITDVHTILSGRKVTGISMTFSKAMDPASVQEVRDYALTPNFGAHPRKVAIKSAQYDSATDTVILTPRGSLDPTKTYQIGAGRGDLVDLQGNGLNETYGGTGGITGAFSITVGAKQPYSAPALVLWGGG